MTLAQPDTKAAGRFSRTVEDLDFAARGLVDAADGLAVSEPALSRRQAFARTVMLEEIAVAQAAIVRAKDAAERAVQS